MALGRQKANWAVASELLAAIYNTIRDTKKRPQPFVARDFDPYAPPPKPVGVLEAFAPLFRNLRKPAAEGND